MKKESVIVIGGGPCGLAAAIAVNDIGRQALVLEKGILLMRFIIIQHTRHFLVRVKN